MYRYSGQSRFNSVMKSNRYRPILVILAIAAVFLIGFLVGKGAIVDSNFVSQRNSRLRSEVQHAVSETSKLSANGSSSNSATLGNIRSYIHGVETLNEMSVSMYGETGRMYTQAEIDELYAIIDSFHAKLQSGQKFSDVLTTLNAAITALQDKTNLLQ